MHSAKFFFFSQVTEQILLINLFFFSPNVLENKSLQYKVWVKLGDIFRLIELNWFLDRYFEHMKRLSILWISILMWLTRCKHSYGERKPVLIAKSTCCVVCPYCCFRASLHIYSNSFNFFGWMGYNSHLRRSQAIFVLSRCLCSFFVIDVHEVQYLNPYLRSLWCWAMVRRELIHSGATRNRVTWGNCFQSKQIRR